jgi:hypothetical protein
MAAQCGNGRMAALEDGDELCWRFINETAETLPQK